MEKMKMRYNIEYVNDCLEISKPNSTILIYRLPYTKLKEQKDLPQILNRFIVYILVGYNQKGKDFIYVGKSKNGIDNRPTSHEDKDITWNNCYILTNFKERTFLNDGTIQFLEDLVQKRIIETERFTATTKVTNTDTANSTEQETCKDYLEEAFLMLNSIGLDLITLPQKEITELKEPDYKMSASASELYKKVISTALEVNPEIKRTFTKFYINFILDDRILFSVEPLKDSLKIFLNADMDKLTHSEILKDVSQVGHHSSGKTLLVLDNKTEMGTLKNYINEVINV